MLANHAPAPDDSPQGDSDYETILTALMETARGRSFLQEYLLKNRTADNATLLTAIRRIEDFLQAKSLEPAGPAPSMLASAATDRDATDGDAMDAEAIVAEAHVSEISVAQTETVVVEVHRIESIPAGVTETDNSSAATAEPLVPRPTQSADPVDSRPQANRMTGELRDPFADFRALSTEEKIALFT